MLSINKVTAAFLCCALLANARPEPASPNLRLSLHTSTKAASSKSGDLYSDSDAARRHKHRKTPVTAFGDASTFDYVEIAVGGVPMKLLIDLVVPITFIGASAATIDYKPQYGSQTSMHWADKHGITGVIYAGILLNSQVTLAPPNGPVLKDFKLGMLAATSVDFGIDYTNAAVTPDGMLGLALRAMSKGDINGAPASQTIEPIAEAMASQGLVSKRNAGVTLQINRRKTLTTQRDTGVLSFGAADTSLINGEFKYAPTELVFGNLSYWATRINIPALGLSDSSVSDNLAVIDTELYLTSLPATVYNNYIASIPGANLQAGFIVIPNESIKHMKPLELRLSTGASLSLPVSAQLLPDAVNVAQSGDPSKYALAIFDGSVDQTGGFLLGTSLLEYFTLHLDSAHSRIGFGVNANYKP